MVRSSSLGISNSMQKKKRSEGQEMRMFCYDQSVSKVAILWCMFTVSTIGHGITTLVGSSLLAPPRSALPHRHRMRIKSLSRVWRSKQPSFYFVVVCISFFFSHISHQAVFLFIFLSFLVKQWFCCFYLLFLFFFFSYTH